MNDFTPFLYGESTSGTPPSSTCPLPERRRDLSTAEFTSTQFKQSKSKFIIWWITSQHRANQCDWSQRKAEVAESSLKRKEWTPRAPLCSCYLGKYAATKKRSFVRKEYGRTENLVLFIYFYVFDWVMNSLAYITNWYPRYIWLYGAYSYCSITVVQNVILDYFPFIQAVLRIWENTR